MNDLWKLKEFMKQMTSFFFHYFKVCFIEIYIAKYLYPSIFKEW